MRELEEIKRILRAHKADLAERFKVKSIGIFGSYVRGEQGERSDLDILVDMDAEHQTFRNYMALKFYLEELLGGKVDVVLKDSVDRRLKERIFRSVVNV